ncbi:hypothetical protein PSCICM_01980 [Pseudomonas cichorii]|uniref:hypothetical protein n=1 Tax=Pseudomonas cichorii TaxID=36746 RepID=UPI0019112175|nr:hypothetical protein [Pseudomonas cichorii]GFM74379.1 hypothetical protein PSCICM_01980 [Pseudomonas cichorii]
MNKHHSFAFLMAILCSACAKTPNIPPADLGFLSFEKGPNNLYIVNFTSNVALLTAFKDYENSNQLTPVLTCSFNGDENFSTDHSINIRAEGRVKAKNQNEPNQDFFAELIFYYNNPDGTQHSINDYDAFKPHLAQQAKIPCKIRITYYGFKAYYTNTLLIPSAPMMQMQRK